MRVLDGADGLPAHQRRRVVDDVFDQPEPVALGTQQRVAARAHAGEPHVGDPQIVETAVVGHGHAGRGALDKEQADAARVVGRAAGARGDDERVGRAAVQHGALVALEHPAVAGLRRPRGHAPQIPARVDLGLRERHLVLALDQRRQDPRALLGAAAARDEAAAEPDGRQIRLDDERLAERLKNDQHVNRRAAEATINRVERHAQDAHLGERGPDVVAEARRRGDDLAARVERIAGAEELAQSVGEEPLLVAVLEIHVAPPPTGRASPWR